MSSGFASLHKILKDETRRKVVLLLDQKGSLSYTDLMEELGFLTTGLLNYHLKVLSDLVSKDPESRYILTDKGKLAAKLLKEFPEGNLSGTKPRWWRRFWIEIAIALAVIIVLSFVLFFLGYIDSTALYRSLATAILAVGFAYMIQHILRDVISKNKKLFIAKTMYALAGVWLGLVISYFGVGLSLALFFRTSGTWGPGNPFFAFFWSIWYQVFALFVAPTLGAIAVYRLGKRRRFKTPNYNPDA